MNLAESEVDPEGMKTLIVCISNQENRMKKMQKHLKKKTKKIDQEYTRYYLSYSTYDCIDQKHLIG